jgi:hypothetical protein
MRLHSPPRLGEMSRPGLVARAGVFADTGSALLARRTWRLAPAV